MPDLAPLRVWSAAPSAIPVDVNMLDTLDVALAFVTVMLAVSLIIMSLTQAVAAVLGLRGARLRRGLCELIKQAAPRLAERIVATQKTLDEFVDNVLQHGLISDSAVTTVVAGPGDRDQAGRAHRRHQRRCSPAATWQLWRTMRYSGWRAGSIHS